MLSRGRRLSSACFLAGAISFGALPFIASASSDAYWSQEPYFLSPLHEVSSVLFLRNDAYGKGYFGASRNHGRRHEGVDLLTEPGKPVLASKSGRVLHAGVDRGYGNWVEVLHPDGYSTRYAHLSLLCVSTGDWVGKGGWLGNSGKTGNARSGKILPHLHFEIRHAGRPLDPGAGWMDPALRFQ